MSKKEKNIELVEDEKQIGNVTVVELKLGNRSLGTVKEENNKFIATTTNGELFRSSTHSEAITFLIKQYHLHAGH